jgi:hypothetical protein
VEFHFSSEETINFSDSHLPEELKIRINEWIEDIVDILRHDPSKVLIDKTVEMINSNEEIYVFATKVFIYFMNESNVYIRESKANDYVHFILKQVILEKIKDKDFQKSLGQV